MDGRNRALAATVALAFLVADCGTAASPVTSFGPSPSEAPTPSSSVAPPPSDEGSSAPPARPSSLPVPSPSSGPSAILAIPAAAVRSLAFSPSLQPPLAVRGSDVFVVEGTGTAARTLSVGDLATRTSVVLAKTDPGHDIVELAATTDRVVWVETWRSGPAATCNGAVPCCPGQGHPLSWQIVSLVVAAGARSVTASGVNTRTAYQGECADVNPPALATDGVRIAYTLEATATGAPFGNRIVVRSLVDGSSIRSVVTKGFVTWLGLGGQALAYRETLGTQLDGQTVQDARLMLAITDDQAPAAIDVHAGSAALSGDLLAWGRDDAQDASLWTVSLGSGARARVAGPPGPDFRPQGLAVSWLVSVSAGHAAWLASGSLNAADQSAIPIVWTLGEPTSRAVSLPAAINFVSASEGWLIWTYDDSPFTARGAPLAALAP